MQSRPQKRKKKKKGRTQGAFSSPYKLLLTTTTKIPRRSGQRKWTLACPPVPGIPEHRNCTSRLEDSIHRSNFLRREKDTWLRTMGQYHSPAFPAK